MIVRVSLSLFIWSVSIICSTVGRRDTQIQKKSSTFDKTHKEKMSMVIQIRSLSNILEKWYNF